MILEARNARVGKFLSDSGCPVQNLNLLNWDYVNKVGEVLCSKLVRDYGIMFNICMCLLCYGNKVGEVFCELCELRYI